MFSKMLFHKILDFLSIGDIFLSSEESGVFSLNLTQRQSMSCNFLDSYNSYAYNYIYAFSISSLIDLLI